MMETIEDFEDFLALLEKHRVRYLIIGGMAFILHARPRYTKDIDIWIDPDPANIELANQALAGFGSPHLLDPSHLDEMLQIGVAPNRIDLLLTVEGSDFKRAFGTRVRAEYGRTEANWIGLDELIEIKSRVDDPRHQADVRVLKRVRDQRGGV